LNNKRTEITAFILSGGKSSRIGIDKAFLSIEGKPLVQRLVELLDSVFSEVVISTNEPDLYNFTGKKIVQDIYSGRGPLAGIYSALKYTDTKRNFIVSCDLPLISTELINYIINYKSEKDIILPMADERIQQLCGIYSKNILNEVEKLLIESSKNNSKLKGSIYELMDRVPTEVVKVDKLDFYHSNLFLNINTPEDYDHLKRIFKNQ
jgi:molybdopterin-guanine dinucleotide biosynthesis protein A